MFEDFKHSNREKPKSMSNFGSRSQSQSPGSEQISTRNSMSLTGLVFGATVGLSARLWSTAMQKRRLFFSNTSLFSNCFDFTDSRAIGPWIHVLMMVGGGYIGYNYSRWENDALEVLNKERILRGMVPITREKIFEYPDLSK